MPRKRHKPEEIVGKLRQVDVLAAQGQSVADAVRAIEVTEVADPDHLRASRLQGARPASLNATQGAAGQRRRRGAHR